MSFSCYGREFIGGPYEPPDVKPWDPDRDGCPECGDSIAYRDGIYHCDTCGNFDLDGYPVEVSDLDETDEPEQ